MLIYQLEKLQKIISTSSSLVIIVEGKKDKKVLSKIGISNVIDISGKSLEKTIKIISLKKPETVAILTDFDKEGERQLKVLTKNFHSEGIKIDNTLRKQIKRTFGIQKIEEINFFIKLLDNSSFLNCSKILNRKNFFYRKRKNCNYL